MLRLIECNYYCHSNGQMEIHGLLRLHRRDVHGRTINGQGYVELRAGVGACDAMMVTGTCIVRL